MAVVNIKTISKILEKSAVARKVFKFTVNALLHILEHQKLIDYRKLEKASLDWSKGTLNLGDGFFEMLMGRAVSEYGINRIKKIADAKTRAKAMSKYNTNNTVLNTQ